MGVTASPRRAAGADGSPRSSSSTAGGGTGMEAVRGLHEPLAELRAARDHLAASRAARAPPPRRTRRRSSRPRPPRGSGPPRAATPCTFASARPIRSNSASAARARARREPARLDEGQDLLERARVVRLRALHHHVQVRARDAGPPRRASPRAASRGRRACASAASSSAAATPRSSAAARNMSPAMPPTGSRKRSCGHAVLTPRGDEPAPRTPRAEAVVDVHHRHVGRAGVQHREQRREPAEQAP